MTRGLDCAAVRDLVPDYVGGDLAAPMANAVAKHLRDCVECRRLAGSQLAAHQALVRAGERRFPGVDDAMFASLHRDVMAMVAAAPTAPRRRNGRLGAAAAAAVLFFCGWIATRQASGLAERSPIRATGTGYSVPLDGPASMRPLGENNPLPFGTPIEDAGLGLRGRLSLRTLEDTGLISGSELTVLPPTAPASPKSSVGHDRR